MCIDENHVLVHFVLKFGAVGTLKSCQARALVLHMGNLVLLLSRAMHCQERLRQSTAAEQVNHVEPDDTEQRKNARVL